MTETERVHLGFSAVAHFEGCQRGSVGVQQSLSPQELRSDKNTRTPVDAKGVVLYLQYGLI